MKASDFSGDSWGRLVRVAGGYEAFIPRSLPPPLESTWALTSALSRADRALAELAGAARALPNPQVLVAPFVRREAVVERRHVVRDLADVLRRTRAGGFREGRTGLEEEQVGKRCLRAFDLTRKHGLAPDERCGEDVRVRQRAGSPGQLGERAIGARKRRSQCPCGLQRRGQRPRPEGLVASRHAHEPAPAIARKIRGFHFGDTLLRFLSPL